ncbi:hypothetical protein DWV26_01440 [Bifidobacterium pseudocatenulatum]|nr:hypothetical protein DWV26_01440 [Bifidobacterium pseudocatenulatum]
MSLTCGFKSHLAHFRKTAEFRQFLVIVVHSISLFENMLKTFCPFASQFFHRLEDLGRWGACLRVESSTDWIIWDVGELVCGWILPLTG